MSRNHNGNFLIGTLGTLGFVEITMCHCGTWIYFISLVTAISFYNSMTAKTKFQLEESLIFRYIINISGSSF